MAKRLLPLFVFLIIATACQSKPGITSFFDSSSESADSTSQNQASADELNFQPTELASSAPLSQGVLATEWRKDKNWLIAIDPSNGGRIKSADPILLGTNFFHAFSPDRRTLALLAQNLKITLHLIDLDSWSDTQIELPIKTPRYFSAVRFSPEGDKLAFATGDRFSTIHIVDLNTQSLVSSADAGYNVREVQFTRDGKGLMLYGVPVKRSSDVTVGDPQVSLYAVHDLSLSWQMSIPDIKDGIYPKGSKTENLHEPGAAWMYQPGIAFDPTRDALYIVHSDAQRMTTVDFKDRSAVTVEIKPQLSWLDRLMALTAGVAHAKVMDGTLKHIVISPDGSTIYTVGMINSFKLQDNGEYELVQTPLNLQSIRTSDGALLAEVPTDTAEVSWFEISIADDGSELYVVSYVFTSTHSQPLTRVFDPETLQVRHTFDDMELFYGRRLNRETLLLGIRYSSGGKITRLASFTPTPFTPLGAWETSRDIFWLRP